jgi:hypothetical protein
MRCLSCNKALSDKEANRKFKNHEEIKNPEDKYMGLCDCCLGGAELDDEDLSHELLGITQGEFE